MEEVDRRAIVRVKQQLAELYVPKPFIYWLDLIVSAGIGWTAFVIALHVESLALTAACLLVAMFALYRALVFTHELDHVPKGALPGFRAVWHVLAGMPFLVPHFNYRGVHRVHHSARYGTSDDPEYFSFAEPGAGNPFKLLVLATYFPLLLGYRYLVLAPLGLCSRRIRAWVDAKASAFVLKADYTRQLPDREEMRAWRIEEYSTAAFAWAVLVCVANGVLPALALLYWYLLLSGSMATNILRLLATAHKYESTGEQLGYEAQIADSVNLHVFSIWNVLIAPVGLAYHATHHAFPDLPYYALGRAHRLLVKERQAEGHPLAFYEATQGATAFRAIANAIRRVRGASKGGVGIAPT